MLGRSATQQAGRRGASHTAKVRVAGGRLAAQRARRVALVWSMLWLACLGHRCFAQRGFCRLPKVHLWAKIGGTSFEFLRSRIA